MTRCEQKKIEMIPAAARELAAQGGVAKLEDFATLQPLFSPSGALRKSRNFATMTRKMRAMFRSLVRSPSARRAAASGQTKTNWARFPSRCWGRGGAGPKR